MFLRIMRMLYGTEIESDETENGISIVYDNVADGQSVFCGGIINNVKKMNTKSGNKDMAIVTVEDLLGTFELMVFPKVYEKVRGLLVDDGFILIKGRVSIREGEKPIILVEEITPWELNEAKPLPKEEEKKIKKLYLKFSLTDQDLLYKVNEILVNYPGEFPVAVQCTTQNKLFALNHKVDGSNALINELCSVLDFDCIKLK